MSDDTDTVPFGSSEVETPSGSAQPVGLPISLDANGQNQMGQRLHPLGLIISLITGLPQLVFPIFAAIFGARQVDHPAIVPLIIGAVLLFSLFFRWVAWMRFRYHLGEDDIRIERGVLSRSARSIPYDRIQDVSIEQKPLARLLGLGEVKFETGGGDGDDAKLSYVALADAAQLRETIKARKAGYGATVEAALAEEDESATPVFAMDGARLLTLGLYSFSLVIFAMLGGLAQQFDFLLPFDLWDLSGWLDTAEVNGVSIDDIDMAMRIYGALAALAGLVAIGILTGIVRTILTDYGFRLDRTAKGFRRRRGLLTLTDVVMPVARVQAAIVETGPVRRRRGWHALRFISLAQESKQESHHMVAPLARLGEFAPIIAEAGIALPGPDATFRKGPFLWWAVWALIPLVAVLIAVAAVTTFAGASFALARWLLLIPMIFLFMAWLEWRNYGDLADASQLYMRENWWNRRLVIARQMKVQSAEIAQGPLARLLGLATLHFGIAGGTLRFAAIPLAEAQAIRDRVIVVVAPVDFSEINRRG